MERIFFRVLEFRVLEFMKMIIVEQDCISKNFNVNLFHSLIKL